MAQVMNGRFTAKMDEPFAVFIIGMRINSFFAFGKRTQRFKPMRCCNAVDDYTAAA